MITILSALAFMFASYIVYVETEDVIFPIIVFMIGFVFIIFEISKIVGEKNEKNM